MPDPRRLLPAILAVMLLIMPAIGQETSPKDTDELLKAQTPPAAKPTDDAKPLTPEKPVALEDSKAATPEPPANESEGKQLLRQSAQAILAAKSISYSGKAYSTGALESLTPKSDGTVKMRRLANAAPDAWLARITGRTSKKGGKAAESEGLDFDVAYLGNKRIEWADAKNTKILEKGERSAQSPIVQGAKGIRIDELFAASPFHRDLTSGAATILDRKTVGGVECEVVQIEMGERKSKTRWYLGVQDHLPRRVDRVVEGAMASDVVVEAADLKFETSEDPSISAASLRIPVPPGWTEERDPLPPPPSTVAGTNAGTDKGATKPIGDGAGSSSTSAPAAPVPAAPPPPRVAPDFELTSAKGDKVSLQAAIDAGASAIVLDFFGPWSLLSRDWHPHLDDLTKRFGERGVRVYALSVRAKNNEDSTNMTKDLAFTTLLDADKVAKDYAIHVYPTTVVINRKGEIVRSIAGGKDDVSEQVAAAIEEAVTGQPAPVVPKPAAGGIAPPKSERAAKQAEPAKDEKEKAIEEGKGEEGKKDQ